MAEDYGAKVSKDGHDVTATPTEATRKNFVSIGSTDAHKIIYSGYVSATSYTHNLGYVPIFFAFETDSVTTPTYFKPMENSPYGVRATTTQITNLTNPSYLILLHRG